ncbi:MAG: hypothetical protein ABIG03_00775 [Candidatus Eisenbacteria bacterium]
MRTIILTLLAVSMAVTAVPADESRTTLGDIPRTYSHYLNAQEAALCRANAATGGIGSYFLNPASVTEISDIAGQATARYNVKTRDYLPDGEESLDASDDGFLFTQFVAVKRSGSAVIGFGYSNPSYRSLEITGQRYHEEELKGYEGTFSGALRYFELIGAARIGDHGQGGLGATVGIVNLSEEARERVVGEELNTARIDGIAACYSVGFSFDVTEAVTVGLGHRLSSTIGVDGEHYKSSRSGESVTQSATVGGLRVRPTDAITVHASYVQDGWDQAKSSLAAYETAYGDDAWKPFSETLRTVAVGVEVALADGKALVRAGYSRELGADIDNAIVPENSMGLGGSFLFDQYVAELAVVRETFLEGGESGQVTNYGLYATVGYEF